MREYKKAIESINNLKASNRTAKNQRRHDKFFESILEFKKECIQNTERKTAHILQTSYILQKSIKNSNKFWDNSVYARDTLKYFLINIVQLT